MRICGPSGLVCSVINDKVSVILHDESVRSLALIVALGTPFALGWYALLAGIEAKVPIILEEKIDVSPGSLQEITRFKGLVELVRRII
jgi:hypothetical protein